jgi:hypothetical protein
MSAESPSAASRIGATPRVDPGKTAFRCGVGRYTVDFLCDEADGVVTIVSDGQLGSSPTTGRLDAATVVLVLAAAGFVREVGVIDTPAWALV